MPNAPTTNLLPRGDLFGSVLATIAGTVWLAHSIFTPVAVMRNRGAYGILPVSALMPNGDVKRSPRSGYNRGDWKMSEGTYLTAEYGWEEVMDDGEADEYSSILDYQAVLAGRASIVLKLKEESRCAAICESITTFPQSGNTGLQVTNKWSSHSNATPQDDVQAGISGVRAQCGIVPDTLKINRSAWYDLWRCDNILQNIKYVVGADAPDYTDASARAQMAKLLGIKNILIADQLYNSAKDGQTEVLTEIWDKTKAFLCVTADSPDIARPTFGRTFFKAADGGLLTIEEYREDKVRAGVIRARQRVQNAAIMNTMAFLFTNIA
jgi:hypothetical protein